MRTKLIGVLGAAVMIAGFVGSPAAHAAQPVTVHVAGNNLIIDDTGDVHADPIIGGTGANQFADVVLDGTTQLTSAPMTPFTVIDPRGTAAGWTLTLTIPTFDNTGATHHIPGAGVTMDAPNVAGTDGQDTSGYTLTGSTTGFTAGIAIVTSTKTTDSMGTFVVSPLPLRLTIPYDTYADDYTAQSTLTLATQ